MEVPLDRRPKQSARAFVFEALEISHRGNRISRIVDLSIIALIVASVIAVVLESIDTLAVRYHAVFYWFEIVTVSLFTVEYLLRLWSSVENPDSAGDSAGDSYSDSHSDSYSEGRIRLRYVFSFHAVIDLLAILPFYLLAFGFFSGADLRLLRAVRLLRILKLTRYSAALNILIATILENGRSLAAAFFILITVMILAASGMYHFEKVAQPVDFANIPAAMWWSFSTLTTVGYGDVTPITVGGKVFGALITVMGLGMVALPTGIIASGFAQQLKVRTERYKDRADEALDDGILTDTELTDLEDLRIELGLGSHTASQILDSEKVRRMLKDKGAETCPHCGSRMPPVAE
jgi:voltage-gated potassium channel